MQNIQQSFLKAIAQTFAAYNKFGARSNKKLIPIHKWFLQIIGKNLDRSYTVVGLGKGGEYTFDGKYYPKTLDISVLNKNKLVATISFKFVTSNYKQNANNYFENLLGETANIRRNNVGFAHFLVLRSLIPYYDKNKGNLRGKLKKIEHLKEKDLTKYVKLFQDQDFPHKPEVLGIAVVDFNKKGKASFADLNSLHLSKEMKQILTDQLSLKNFIQKFIALCKLKS